MLTIPINIVPVKNGINFRDLGGIETTDGRKIRSGLLFRSGAFSELTEQERNFIGDTLSIKFVLDYRDMIEIEAQPDKLWQSSIYINASANPLNNHEITASLTSELSNKNTHFLKKENPVDFMIRLYQLLPFNNSAYTKLVDLLLNSNGQSIVQHCAIGKDRTGVGVALMLFILGVDEKVIMQDYLLTEQVLASYREKLLRHYATGVDVQELENRRQIFSAKPEYLQSALDTIKSRYPSIEKWLATEYQLTAQHRRIIQDYYLI